jgi:hypothetical protein
MELSAQPTLIPRDGGSATLRAQAFDGDGAPLVGAFISFRSEIGALASGGASKQTDESGAATDMLTVTRNDISSLTDAFFVVTATTSGDGGAPIEETIEIDIGGTPASMFFQATPTTIPQTGGSVQLLAGVRDGAGDPLAGILVNFLTDLGTLNSGGSSIETNGAGEARDTLTATESELTAFGGTAFTIRVQAAGIGGNILEQATTIRIQTGIPRASFISEGVSGSPMEYQFTSTSTGQAPLTCAWQFGDGGTESQQCTQTVSHTYGANGSFTVTLTVTNSLGNSSASGSVTVPHND